MFACKNIFTIAFKSAGVTQLRWARQRRVCEHKLPTRIINQANMRKRKAFVGIFAPNFKRACDFLLKIRRGVSPEVFVEHFNAHIIPYIQHFCNYFLL